jgi:hypothetical protein
VFFSTIRTESGRGFKKNRPRHSRSRVRRRISLMSQPPDLPALQQRRLLLSLPQYQAISHDTIERVHERLVYHVLAGEQDSDHFLVPFDYAPSTRRIATLRETYRPRRMQAPSVLSKDGWMSFQNVALHPALVELEVDEAIGESFASEYGQRLLRTISMQCSSMLQVSDDFEQVRVLPESAWPGNLFGFLSAEQRCIVAATCSKMRTASVFDETYKNNAALGPWMDDSRVLESAWNLSTCITSDPPSPDTDPARAFRLIGGVRSYCLFYHRDRWMAHGEETEPENSLAHPSAMTNAWNALWERLHAFMLLRDAPKLLLHSMCTQRARCTRKRPRTCMSNRSCRAPHPIRVYAVAHTIKSVDCPSTHTIARLPYAKRRHNRRFRLFFIAHHSGSAPSYLAYRLSTEFHLWTQLPPSTRHG